MKKLFLFVSLFAALSTGVYADDIWGNSQNDEQSTVDRMGTRSWMRSNSTRPDAKQDGSDLLEDYSPAPNDAATPVGEGALVLLIGGGLYAVSKLRRK